MTGVATGVAASLDDVRQVKQVVKIPVLVGSGVTLDNVDRYLPVADGLIVGSYFKQGGRWSQPVDAERVKTFMGRVKRLR